MLCRKVAKVAAKTTLRKDVLVGFDAVGQFLVALQERLGHCAIFCADALGGDVIGIKWKPHAFAPAPFRVATAHSSMPCGTSGEDVHVLDTVAVLRDVMQIGQGLVADIFLTC